MQFFEIVQFSKLGDPSLSVQGLGDVATFGWVLDFLLAQDSGDPGLPNLNWGLCVPGKCLCGLRASWDWEQACLCAVLPW